MLAAIVTNYSNPIVRLLPGQYVTYPTLNQQVNLTIKALPNTCAEFPITWMACIGLFSLSCIPRLEARTITVLRRPYTFHMVCSYGGL
jgi:hypothetical protein